MHVFEILNDLTVEKFSAKHKKLQIATGNSDAAFMIAKALNEQGSLRIVVVKANKIVGAASYYIDKDKTAVIEDLGSLIKGVGSLLLDFIIKDAQSKKSKKIILWATEEGDSLYLKFGFKPNPDNGEGFFEKFL